MPSKNEHCRWGNFSRICVRDSKLKATPTVNLNFRLRNGVIQYNPKVRIPVALLKCNCDCELGNVWRKISFGNYSSIKKEVESWFWIWQENYRCNYFLNYWSYVWRDDIFPITHRIGLFFVILDQGYPNILRKKPHRVLKLIIGRA